MEPMTYPKLWLPNSTGSRLKEQCMKNRYPVIQLALESPLQPEIVALVEALDEYLESLYPADSNHLVSVDSLASGNVRFLVARADGRAVGCGALVLDPRGYGEIKRIYVDPEYRGLRIAGRILRQLERLALGEDLQCLRLETGIHQLAAIELFRRAGYVERTRFGDYPDDPLSVFMEKRLA